MTKQRVVCFVAGRSGGHIVPGLTLAQEHKDAGARIVFFSTNTPLDMSLIARSKIVDTHIPLALDNVPKKLLSYPIFCLQAVKALCKSLYYLKIARPELVISMGGYISLPVCLAARILRIPYDIVELNVIPGKAVKALAPYARTVYTCFSATRNYLPQALIEPISYPIRFKKKGSRKLPDHFSTDRTTVFIVGGSQGSLFINGLIREWIIAYPHLHEKVQIIHQTGAQDSADWQAFYREQHIPAITFAYHDAIEDYYALADLIICRSGAGTLFEILFFKKPCITIPLETAITDHQLDNATSMAREYPDLFTVIRQQDITTSQEVFFNLVQTQLVPKPAMETMSSQAKLLI